MVELSEYATLMLQRDDARSPPLIFIFAILVTFFSVTAAHDILQTGAEPKQASWIFLFRDFSSWVDLE